MLRKIEQRHLTETMYLKYTTADSIYRQIELITHKNGEDIQFPDFPLNWDNTMNTEYLILNNNKKKEQDNKPLDSYHYGAGLKVQRI